MTRLPDQVSPAGRSGIAYFVRRAQEHGLITRVLGGDVIAFSPPLIISAAEIDLLLERAARALDDTLDWVRRGA